MCPLVGGPGAWCLCLVFLPGLVVWACPLLSSLGPISSFGFEKRLQPREPSQRPVFRQVTLFSVPYHLPLLRLFRQMSFHSVLPASLQSLRAKVVPAETGESELSIFFLHYASSTSRTVPSATLVVQTPLSRVTHALLVFLVPPQKRLLRQSSVRLRVFTCELLHEIFISACEEHACERIRQGLASHSLWFWCFCSRYRRGSKMRSLKATQVLSGR